MKMSTKKFYLGFVLILILAIISRFYQLGVVPHGMTWDEAAIGYNGFAIFNTRRDEWLHRLPISFMSFGDFKAPAAIYLNGFFTALLGMNLWVVRLPFALFGIAAIAGIMLLIRQLTDQKSALVAGGLMLLSPWQLHYSRAGFESGMSLSLMIWSLYFLFSYLKNENKKFWYLSSAVILAIGSIYTYHSAKIVVPLIFAIIFTWYYPQFLKQLKQTLPNLLLGLLLMGPMIWDSIRGRGLERLSTTIMNELSGWQLIKTIIQQFLVHLSPRFLVFGQTTTLRHGDGHWGVLLPTTLVLVMLGLYFGFRKFQQRYSEVFYLGIALILVGLIPAALGEEIPHSNRALLALPGFILLAVLGFKSLLKRIKNPIIKNSFFGTLLLIHCLFFITYISDYFTVFAKDSADAFKDGYLEAFEFVVPHEDRVDKIIFTSDYGQAYIYALFVRQTNPIWYQGGSLVKYEFKDEIDVGDLARKNTIVVASKNDEIEAGWADKLVYGSDNEVRFKIYLPKEK